MNRGAWPFWLWTALILMLVLPWTTFQNHSHWQRVAWIPFVSPPIRIRDVVANVLLYAPWGYLFVRHLSRRSQQIWVAIAVAAALSLVTEASQLYSHGRFPSATDLVCNTAGACLGAIYARRRSDLN